MISEAVWWVTIVDATLVRHHPEAYDGVLAGQDGVDRVLLGGVGVEHEVLVLGVGVGLGLGLDRVGDGLGVPPPAPSWGVMIEEARDLGADAIDAICALADDLPAGPRRPSRWPGR